MLVRCPYRKLTMNYLPEPKQDMQYTLAGYKLSPTRRILDPPGGGQLFNIMVWSYAIAIPISTSNIRQSSLSGILTP